jgi:tetratricopeptide (TPR) repeat protein
VGSGWTVSDLGSGNGTLVNGEPISDETVLGNGDVITLGDTEVTFSDVSNATMMVAITPGPVRPRAATGGVPARPGRPERVRPGRAAVKQDDPAAKRKKKIFMAVGAVGFVLAASGLVALQIHKKNQAEQDAIEAINAAKVRAQLAAIFQEAKNHIRGGKWEDAKAKLLELQGLAPDYPGLSDYLATVEKEIPNQEHVAAAQKALGEKKLAVAKAELDKVSPETTMYELVGNLKRQLRDTADAQTKEARALLDNKQLDPAKAITDDVLVAFAEDRDAKLINDEAVRLITIRDTPVRPPPPPPTAPPWEQAVARFVDGDVSGAVALLNACSGKQAKCRSIMKDITEFNNLYKKLEDLEARGLQRLLVLDKEITGSRGPSKMAKIAGTRAANIFYKSASTAKAAGQYARAVEYARRTLQADPNHAGAANILNDLRTKAKDIYLQAYAAKDSNPEDAIPKFREVLAMTPPDDETHGKAQHWLDTLQR